MNAPEKLPVSTAMQFVSIPETVLPSGRVVPAFEVGQYLTGKGVDGNLLINAEAEPWVRIDYHEANVKAHEYGLRLIPDSQSLALAYQIALQDQNWTGGKVGQGKLFQGLRKGSVSSAKPGWFEPADTDERRWFVLPDGQKIYDVAGNAYSWVFDDTQGDNKGVIAQRFSKDSDSLVIPFPGEERGQGWTPSAGNNWSGGALVRGGCWDSGSNAGVFRLDNDWPDGRYVDVGFRCTKPIGL